MTPLCAGSDLTAALSSYTTTIYARRRAKLRLAVMLTCVLIDALAASAPSCCSMPWFRAVTSLRLAADTRQGPSARNLDRLHKPRRNGVFRSQPRSARRTAHNRDMRRVRNYRLLSRHNRRTLRSCPHLSRHDRPRASRRHFSHKQMPPVHEPSAVDIALCERQVLVGGRGRGQLLHPLIFHHL